MTHFHLFLNWIASMRNISHFPMFHHFLTLFLICLSNSPYISFLKKHDISQISSLDDIFNNCLHSFFVGLRVIEWLVPEKSLRHKAIFVFQEKFKKFLRILNVGSNVKNKFITILREVWFGVDFIFTF